MAEEIKLEGDWFICCTCLTYINKKKTPKLSIFNDLKLEKIPEELKLTEVENQLIARDILFMKLKLLPKSRIGAMVDRVVNVPLEDKDIISNVTTLPRTFSGILLTWEPN